MKIVKIKTIYKKEIMDLLRDKKTLIMMVLIPLLLYPLIMMGSMLFSSAIANNIKTSEYTIAIIDENVENTSQYNKEAFRELLTDTEDEVEANLVIKEIEADKCAEALASEEIDERGAPLVELACKISCVALATRSLHCFTAHVPH